MKLTPVLSTPTPHPRSPPGSQTHRHKQTHTPLGIIPIIKHIGEKSIQAQSNKIWRRKRERHHTWVSEFQSMLCKNLLPCTGEIDQFLLAENGAKSRVAKFTVSGEREKGREWEKNHFLLSSEEQCNASCSKGTLQLMRGYITWVSLKKKAEMLF